jgi:hypothetical protein
MTPNERPKSDGQKQLESLYGYELPEQKEEFIDVEKNAIINKKDISPIEIIKAVANKNGIKLYLGAKGCHHCHDRKYIGFNAITHEPIPCSCLYRGRTTEQKQQDLTSWSTHTFNRAKKREMKKGMRKFIRLANSKPAIPQQIKQNSMSADVQPVTDFSAVLPVGATPDCLDPEYKNLVNVEV